MAIQPDRAETQLILHKITAIAETHTTIHPEAITTHLALQGAVHQHEAALLPIVLLHAAVQVAVALAEEDPEAAVAVALAAVAVEAAEEDNTIQVPMLFFKNDMGISHKQHML